MLEELSELIGLQVYTNNGVFLGNVNNLVLDIEHGNVEGIFVQETNPLLVEGSMAVSVPFRWIQSVGDVVLLRYFPKHVSVKKGIAAPSKSAAVPAAPQPSRADKRVSPPAPIGRRGAGHADTFRHHGRGEAEAPRARRREPPPQAQRAHPSGRRPREADRRRRR